MKIAIIDLGSNSARMTIWEYKNGKTEKIYNKRVYVRLSEGLSADDMIKEEPLLRTLEALADFAETIKDYSCDKVKAVGTETLRRAKNSKAFTDLIFKNTGISLTVLTGEEESEYDYLASKDLTDGENAYIMDVGGGSLELIKINSGKIDGFVCLPDGAVVTADKFGSSKDILISYFTELFASLPLLKNCPKGNIIALGGSIRAMASYINGKASQGDVLVKDDFLKAFDSICGKSIEELKEIEDFKERADIVAAGLAPYAALAKIVSADKIILNNCGVREGILIECIAEEAK
ncbi:MAG: hypothetical protein Q8882_07310 [Bacillota bacterium]|nr:hypothetical protein [Bacillota bacterium]